MCRTWSISFIWNQRVVSSEPTSFNPLNCREIEAEYRKKISDLESGIERRIKVAKDEYGRKKDEEFTKLSIGLRRDMDENLRKERSNIRKALDAANAQVNPNLPL